MSTSDVFLPKKKKDLEYLNWLIKSKLKKRLWLMLNTNLIFRLLSVFTENLQLQFEESFSEEFLAFFKKT